MAYIPAKNEPIAIIGSHCRFPGPATTPSKLWSLLKDPTDLSRQVPSTRWNVDGFHHPNGEHHGTTNAPKAYFLAADQDPRFFDASFFNITPKEAEAIDPQGKILLEVVYDAMESAGIPLHKYNGERVGVFVGTMTSDYDQLTCKDAISTSQYCGTGLSRALLSNRISYFFNWSGPSMTIDTACSSSLVAMHQAVASLRNGDSSVACVAGANIMVAPDAFMAESSLHMLSPNGRSRMWDEGADGYARGEGAGVFFLKTLSRALADGDDIECVIRETGVNSDGRTLGITMPSSAAQTALILDTYRRSGLDPRDPQQRCQYFEAHGTGTQAGDPQEAEAIFTAFFGDRTESDKPFPDTQKLLVGSIKTVIGHTEGAAGAAGVMKTALGLKHRLITPNQHFVQPNPKVSPFLSRLKVPVELVPWPQVPPGHPQRASVNSFGFGGTNAHAILERYEPDIHGVAMKRMVPRRASQPALRAQSCVIPLLLSASTPKALARKAHDLLAYLIAAQNGVNMRSVLGTLAFHRSVLPHKLSILASTPDDLIKQLGAKVEPYLQDPKADISIRSKDGGNNRILGIFTGQGAQWPMMGAELIHFSPTFRGALQAMDVVLKSCCDPPTWSIVDELLAPPNHSRLGEAAISQPLCTAIQIALVDVLAAAGVHFGAVIGHSSGEIAAAYAAGSISADEAILTAYYRGLYARLAQGPNGQKGGMLAVGMAFEEASAFCAQAGFQDRVFVAASNAPASVTLSGDLDCIEACKAQLDEAKTFCRLLKVDTAYHSHHMDRCSGVYLAALKACNISAKQPRKNVCNWVSSVYGPVGDPTTEELAGRYWKDNMVQPVLFSDALSRAILEHGPFDMALEVGPHPALKGPATETIQETIGKKIPYHGILRRGQSDLEMISDTLGNIWCTLGAGVVDWNGYRQAMEPSITSYELTKELPPYPWEHSQIHYRTPRAIRQYLNRQGTPHELLGVRTSDDSRSELRWQNILKPTMVPWLRHHRFQGQIIVPAAAYCVMALDAARAMAGGTAVGLVEIQDLVIYNGISMDEIDSDGIDTIFSLRLEDSSHSSGGQQVLKARFLLDWSPANSDRPTKKAVSGLIIVHLGLPWATTYLPMRMAPDPGLKETDVDEFYSSIGEIGLSYTGPFRAIQSLRRRRHFASAQLEKPHPEDTSTLSVRPSMIDSSFQSVFAAFAAPGDGALWTSFLPKSIQRLRFNMDLCQVESDVSSIVDVDATITYVQPATKSEPYSFTSNIDISNAKGEVEIQLEGLTVAALAASSASEDRELYVHTISKPDAWEGFATVSEISLPTGTNAGISVLQCRLTQVVALISHRHPRLNVLEIDLGNLRLSEAVWAGLSASVSSYTFMSPEGEHLATEDAGGPPPRKFQKVQLPSVHSGKDFLGQKLDYGPFDLVVISIPDQFEDSSMKQNDPHGIRNDSIWSAIHGIMRPGGFLIIARHSIAPHGQQQDPSLTSGVSPRLLNSCGFGSLLYGYDVVSSSGSLLVTQAMNEAVAILRSPLSDPSAANVSGTVLIVGGQRPLTASISSRLTKILSLCSSCNKVIAVPCLEKMNEIDPAALANLRSAVILADLDDPILNPSTINKPRLENLQRIFEGSGRYVLWLTRGFRDANPYHAATVGLARTIRGETPQLLLQILDLDDHGREDTEECVDTEVVDRVVEAYLRLAMARESEDEVSDVLWTTESEILLSGRKSLLPRVIPVQESNDRINCARRVINQQKELKNSILQLVPQQGDAELIYRAQWESKEGQDSQLGSDSTITVQALCTSIWALQVGGSGSFLHAGVGIPVGTEKVVAFFSPTNSSVVTIPRAWTVQIDLALGNGATDRNVVAGLLVRSILAQSLVRGAELRDGTTLIHEADTSFVGILKSILAAPGRSKIGHRFNYSTLDWETAATNKDFNFIHPQSTQRAVQATIPADLTNLVDFSTSQGSERINHIHVSSSARNTLPKSPLKLQNLPGVNLCLTIAGKLLDTPCQELARTSGTVGQRYDQENINSSLMEALELIDSSAVSASARSDRFVLDVSDLIGRGLQSRLAVVDWRQASYIEEQVRPFSLQNLLGPHQTYLLIGLTGELGESLCRFMIEHGARNIVVASRDPTKAEGWASEIHDWSGGKALVHLVSLDVTDISAVRRLKSRLAQSHPPVAGIVNGAMVLNDGLFADMSLENLVGTLRPKVLGSQNLDTVFDDPNLDFFMLFSSLVCLTGNNGQANYAAANMYMAGLAACRRKRGLAASVVDIGMVIGIGYANRVDGTGVYENLRRQGYLPISERDIHDMFVEAIAAGKHGSSTPLHLSTGLQRFNPGQQNALPWQLDPRFSHHTADEATPIAQQVNSDIALSGKFENALEVDQSLDTITRRLTAAFLAQLESMLRLAASSVDANCPIIDLGVDSLVAVEVRAWFLKVVGKDMPVLKVLGGASAATLCAEVAIEIYEDRREAADSEQDDLKGSADTTTDMGSFTDESTTTKIAESTEPNSAQETPSLCEDETEIFEEIARMSFGQARMWFPFLLLNDKTTYNCTTSYRLRGLLDVARYEKALVDVTRKYQAFRTCFYTDDITGEPMQAVMGSPSFKLRKASTGDEGDDFEDEKAIVSGHVFNLEQGDVFVATLVRHSDDYHTIIFGYHHIILDGVSWQQVLKEVESFCVHPVGSPSLPEVDYLDFSANQRAILDSEDFLKKRQFWKRSFDGKAPPPMPLLPFAKARNRAPLSQYKVVERQVMLDKTLVERIKKVASEHQATSFHFYLTVMQVMLHKYLRVDDICVGIADANRSDPGFMNTVGLLLDSLPLRSRSQPETSSDTKDFAETLQRTRRDVYSAVSNSGVPLDVILDDLAVDGSASTMPLFQALVNYRMGALKQKSVGDVSLDYLAYQDAKHPFDFILTIDEEEDWAAITLSMQDYLYDSAAAETFGDIYVHMLESFSLSPCTKVGESEHYPSSLCNKAVHLGRGPELTSTSTKHTLVASVDKAAKLFPEDVAVRENAMTFTYDDLMKLVHQTAAILIRNGVGQGARVGVLSGPSAGATTALLAILRIGAIYVPLDERNSTERLFQIVQDSETHTIIVSDEENKTRAQSLVTTTAVARPPRILDLASIMTAHTTHGWRHIQHVQVEDRSSWDHLAFIMFTSGTTGKPKGVMITHGNMATHVAAARERMCLGRETVLAQSALGYDASLAQAFYALESGGTLVVSSNRREMGEVAALIRDAGVSLTLMSPSEYAVLFQYGREFLKACRSWHTAMVGGEALPPRIQLDFRGLGLHGLRLFNAYGPSEISVASNIGEVNYIDALLAEETNISIGLALPGYHVCLIDDARQPVPIGCRGQIAVSGQGVSAGYLNNETLTKAKFLPGAAITVAENANHALNSHWYLTGDMARMSSSGSLFLLGRIDGDTQIKLRGIRIEPTDIARSIIETSLGVVAQAVVGGRGEGADQFLLAFVVFAPNHKPENPDRYLGRLMADLPLPSYMRPARTVQLESLPTNASGKLDMRSLDAMPLSTGLGRTSAQDPSHPCTAEENWNSTEERLRKLWIAVLGDTGIPITRESDFFSAGGNSLSLLRLQVEIKKGFGTKISLPELFRASTLSTLARNLSSRLDGSTVAYEPDAAEIDWATETTFSPSPVSYDRGIPSTKRIREVAAPITSVILTGATGFLGRTIARDLQSRSEIRSVHCIAVRDSSSPSAQALVKDCPKAILYAGDLSQPWLGLSRQDVMKLFSDPGVAVVHNGADVSFMKPYEALRAPNVLATRELALLCLSSPLSPPPPLHYVSTAGVGILALAGSPDGIIRPVSLAAYEPGKHNAPAVDGYVASKWASEVMLERAAQATDLGVHIYRPSSITGDGAPPLDVMQNVLAFSRAIGAVPDTKHWSGSFDFVSVEAVARGIVEVALSVNLTNVQPTDKAEFLHLSGELVVPVSTMKDHMERAEGQLFRELSMQAWIREARSKGLHELIGTYLGTIASSVDIDGAQPVFPTLESSLLTILVKSTSHS